MEEPEEYRFIYPIRLVALLTLSLLLLMLSVDAAPPTLIIISPQDGLSIPPGFLSVEWEFKGASQGSQIFFVVDGLSQYISNASPVSVPIGEGNHTLIAFLRSPDGTAYGNPEAQFIKYVD